MSILVVGSVALDTVETPFGKVEDALGGSAIYFSTAASYFAPVRVVGVVGEDFGDDRLAFLKEKNVDLSGLVVKPGKTFRWGGKYGFDLNTRETLFTHLNVFEDFDPVIPETFKDSQYVFLGNIAPELQLSVLQQISSPKLVALDTMNFWIEGSLPALKKTLKEIDVLIVNDAEARQLSQEPNLVKAARHIHELGPRVIIIKKGEHGALLISEGNYFWAPAYPLEFVYDPTGAGDTFAGGFLGYLAMTQDLSFENFKRAVVFGSTLASFCVEAFSLEKLKVLRESDIRQRFQEFWEMTNFDHVNSGF
ncbi:MAG: sugar kinase [Calditrichaeota bacterium]|nr:MAG: sugar kinase [Calditrichota bacterium]